MCKHGPGGWRCRSAQMYRAQRNDAEDQLERMQDKVDDLTARVKEVEAAYVKAMLLVAAQSMGMEPGATTPGP